jgi:hypothetical protein
VPILLLRPQVCVFLLPLLWPSIILVFLHVLILIFLHFLILISLRAPILIFPILIIRDVISLVTFFNPPNAIRAKFSIFHPLPTFSSIIPLTPAFLFSFNQQFI